MEQWQRNNPEILHALDMKVTHSPRRALANSAVTITHDLGLLGIFVPTTSGTTAGVVSAFRPSAPLIGICEDESTARLLMMHWGVTPIVMHSNETSDWENMIYTIANGLRFKLKNQSVAVLSGFGKRSDNNQPVLKILRF